MLRVEASTGRAISASGAFALWNLGFRPFYLLASGFAALSVVLWVCQYAGYLPAAYVRNPAWHGHEMLYGYTMAVVAGIPPHGGSQLDREADAHRRHADRACSALGSR